jgi:hypothetical protein
MLKRREKFPRRIVISLFLIIFAAAGCQQLPPSPPPPPQEPPQIPDYQLMVNPFEKGDPAGTGAYHVGVVPTRWFFKYDDDAHHYGANQLDTYGITVGPEWVDWENFVRLRDKNGDDTFRWYVQSTIVGMHHSFMTVERRTVLGGNKGSSDPIPQFYQNTLLKGFDAATVVLVGWRLDFWDPGVADHHIAKMGIRIQSVAYDPDAGRIDWTVRSYLSDRNDDDRYVWGYTFLIIAFNNGAVRSETAFTWLGGSKVTLQGTMQAPAGGQGRNHGIVLPQGWHYDATLGLLNDDAHMRTHRFWLQNQSFDGSRVSYSIKVRFPCCGEQLDRSVSVDLVGLFFDNGGIGLYPTETDWAPSGWPGKDYREVRFRYFYPLNFPVP